MAFIRSYDKCIKINIKNTYTQDEMDDFENLASRYARSCDLLLSKIYRAIDSIELIDGGTLIDIMNRACKRGLIDNIEQIRELKDLRNEIVHEYLPTEISNMFSNVLQKTPILFDLIDRVIKYSKKY